MAKIIYLKCSKESAVETFLLRCIREVTLIGINQYHENACSASTNRNTMENESTLYKVRKGSITLNTGSAEFYNFWTEVSVAV